MIFSIHWLSPKLFNIVKYYLLFEMNFTSLLGKVDRSELVRFDCVSV